MKDSLDLVNQKILSLQHKLDSINTAYTIKELQYKLNEQQNIVASVNDFYDSAWTKLIILITALGVLVPLFVQYLQRRNFNDLTEFISGQMKEDFEIKLRELKEYNGQRIEEATNDFRVRLEKLSAVNKKIRNEIDGGIFYLQAKTLTQEKKHSHALRELVKSAKAYGKSSNPGRVDIVLKNLTKFLQGCKTKTKLKELSKELDKDLVIEIRELKKDKHFDKFADKLTEIENYLLSLPE